MTNMNTLAQLHADIDARVRAIRGDYPDWLCRMGCDGCCHRLAEIPRLTNEEWDWLREGLAALPTESLREIELEVAALAGQPLRPIVCPLLNRSAGSMPIVRWLAARTGSIPNVTRGFTVRTFNHAWLTVIGSEWFGATRMPSTAVFPVLAKPAN